MARHVASTVSSAPNPATPSPKQRLRDKLQAIQSLDTPTAPQCDLDLISVFRNAILVHQKRLKTSASQLFKALITIDPLILEYYAAMEMVKANGFKAGPDAARARKQKRTDIAQAIERYDSLLEERRQILQKQDTWLHATFEVREFKGTDKMLEAINMQIAAAEDLSERVAAREANNEWKTFKDVPRW